MQKIIKKLIKSDTAKDSSLLFAGTIISNIFGFVVIAILTRNLDPSGFGLFITAMTFAQLIADFFELGINISVLNFVSSAVGVEKLKYVKNSFVVKLAIQLTVVFFILTFAELITMFLFRQEAMIPFVKISILGVLFLSFITWAQNVFQAEKDFFGSSLLNTSTNFFRFLIIGLMLQIGSLTPITAYLGFQLVLALSLAIFFVKFGVGFFKNPIEMKRIKEMMKFGLPIGVSFTFAAVYTRLDQLLVFNYLGSEQAGIYGLAYRLIAVLVFFITSFSTAIAPRFASLTDQKFGNYFKKSLIVSLGLIVVTIMGAILAPFVIPLFFGDKFTQSIPIFQILSIGIVFFILTIPLNLAIIFRAKKNNFILVLSIIALLATWLLLHLLIPNYGIVGAAVATTIVNGIQLVIYIGYYWYLRKKSK